MNLNDITIYAVHEADGSFVGYSFHAAPGSAEPDRVHTPIDADNPGGDLYLLAYSTPAEAAAFTDGLEVAHSADSGCLVHTFAENLNCVLVDFIDSAGNALHIEDIRPADLQNGGAP
jgi:hypothetical protein